MTCGGVADFGNNLEGVSGANIIGLYEAVSTATACKSSASATGTTPIKYLNTYFLDKFKIQNATVYLSLSEKQRQSSTLGLKALLSAAPTSVLFQEFT